MFRDHYKPVLQRKIPPFVLALLLILTVTTATAAAQDNDTADSLTAAEQERASVVKAALQEAYAEHQIADDYVSSAYQTGADTGDLDQRLGSLQSRLKEGLELLEEKKFDEAEAAAEEVISGAREVQEEAESRGQTTRISDAIDRIGKEAETERGKALVEEAREANQNGDTATVQHRLKLAQQVEQVHDLRTYLDDVSGRTDADLSSFTNRLDSMEEQIEQGSDRRNALSFLARDLRTAVKAVEAVEEAERAVETGGTDASREQLNRARELLDQGNYGRAMNLAYRVTGPTEDQTTRQEEQSEQGFLQRILAVLLSIFSPTSSPEDLSLPEPGRLAAQNVEVDYEPPTSSRVRAIEFDGLSGELPSDRVYESAPARVVTRNQPVRTVAPTPVPKAVHFFLETDDPVPCGTTCRQVTATIHNNGNIDAHNVKVTSTITTGGTVIWEGKESIGTLTPGQIYTTTRTIEVGYWDALKIKQNGGTVTIKTVVTSDEKTIELSEERKIA